MSIQMLLLLILDLAVMMMLIDPSNGEIIIISGNGHIAGGQYRYFYDQRIKASACTNVVLLGVGTGMTTSDYNLISTEMVRDHEIVTIVTDHTPGFVLKKSYKKYIYFMNAIVANLHSLVPICTNDNTNNTTSATTRKIIVAGHSASGGTAWNCLFQLSFLPHGFLGLDPFQLDPHGRTQVNIPTLNIGFSETTCLVTVDDAAKASYETSGTNHRVLYLINNTSSSKNNPATNTEDTTTTNGTTTTAPGTTGHCSFTDRGCFGPVCPSRVGDAWVRASVGLSIHVFVQSLSTGLYHKEDYILPRSYATTMVDSTPIQYALYVNQDNVETNSVQENAYFRNQLDFAATGN